MNCIPYILNTDLPEEEKNRLQEVHNEIFDKAKDSKAFKIVDGKYYSYKQDYASATKFISEVKNKYGDGVAKLVKETNTKTKLVVNVLPSKLKAKPPKQNINNSSYYVGDAILFEQETKQELRNEEKQEEINSGKLLPVFHNDKFNAIDRGNIEGRPDKETKPIKKEMDIETPFDRIEGSKESFNEAKNRILDAWKDILEHAPNNTVVITSSSPVRVIQAWEEGGKVANNLDEKVYLEDKVDNGEILIKKGNHGQTIYIIRHGETTENLQHIERTKNVKLSEKGITTAKESAIELYQLLEGKIPTLISSELPRAKQTGEIITEELAKLTQEDNLKKEIEKAPNISKLTPLMEEQQVVYTLKVVHALNTGKVRNFDSSKSEGFYNDLIKQGVNKEQLELVKETLKGYDKLSAKEAATLLENAYKFKVEVKTAKQESIKNYGTVNTFTLEGIVYTDAGNLFLKNNLNTRENSSISKEEYIKALNKKEENKENTSYYSNLTVPGGTNYTENEISTPDITPSIKGHAQFSTDKGIGWWRSDDVQSMKDLNRELHTQDFNFEELLKRGEIKQIPC